MNHNSLMICRAAAVNENAQLLFCNQSHLIRCAFSHSSDLALQFRKRFKPKQAESVIHDVLQEKLKGKVYAVDQVTALTKELSEAVKAQLLKDLDIPRYKIIVQVCKCAVSPGYVYAPLKPSFR